MAALHKLIHTSTFFADEISATAMTNELLENFLDGK